MSVIIDGNSGVNTGNSVFTDSSGSVGIGTVAPNSGAFWGRALTLNGPSGQNAAYELRYNGSLTGYLSYTTADSGFNILNYANSSLNLGTNNTVRMVMDSSGNVGIGTNTPATPLHVNGTIRYTNRPAAGTITAIGYDTNGDLKNATSSLRYKYDVTDYTKGIDVLMQLRPVNFKFNGETRENSGFVAEEVDALGLKEVMLYDEDGRPDGIIYTNMLSLLTKALQELKAEFDAYKAAHP